MSLKQRVLERRKSGARLTVQQRLSEFRVMRNRSDARWFSELCFCILAANAKGKNAWKIQRALGPRKLQRASQKEICTCIRSHNHRFHNTKARYIVEARSTEKIKENITRLVDRDGIFAAREWLVHNIKGIGYKEASHFLRNIGFDGVAILDRHILRLLAEDARIVMPSTLTPKRYLAIEQVVLDLSRELALSPAELDLYLWSMKTGEVLK
jgi:N-glycosylase/DNA lyase